jgi:hypothetical protein
VFLPQKGVVMKWLENRSVRMIALAACGALAVVVARAVGIWAVGQAGGSSALIGELMGSKLLFTKMAVYFMGLILVGSAFAKQSETGRWKMFLSVLGLSMIPRLISGGAIGSIDTTLLFLGIAAVVVTELDGNVARIVGSLISGFAIVLLVPDDADPYRRNALATVLITTLFVGPAVFVSSVMVEGKFSFAPIRRFVAAAVPSR